MKPFIMMPFFLCCVSFILTSCGKNEIPQPLDRAIQTAYQMTSAGMLEHSAFYAIFPEGTPRQFVSFIFSDIGTAEGPPVEGSGEFDPEEEQSMRAAFMPIWPAGVGMTHSKPDPNMGMQVVWKWDDGRRIIILEGYADPNQPPVIIKESNLPIVKPSEMARIAAESSLETGGRAQRFQ
jgi:hypothetical protein